MVPRLLILFLIFGAENKRLLKTTQVDDFGLDRAGFIAVGQVLHMLGTSGSHRKEDFWFAHRANALLNETDMAAVDFKRINKLEDEAP